MELPPALRQAVDAALEGVPPAELARASQALSARYRSELRDGRLHLADDLAARAYLAARLPATYAALRSVLGEIAALRPDFGPRSLFDFGAGPGTALWAARDCWPDLASAALIEASAPIRAWGERMAAGHTGLALSWSDALVDSGPGDLVTLSYVLDELEPEARNALIDRLWALTDDTLLIVEPGTPAGWQRTLAARARLLSAGAHLVAPCPHAHVCPLQAPDWCHFSRRVARSRTHLQAKDAAVPWEDEKFIYIAVSRFAGAAPAARVIAPPRKGSGKVELKLCRDDGTAVPQLFTRREGERFKQARRADWGDAL
ncbi:MAG TPA: small ribosomal subunit Rsm22 family protein [Candidatus Binatia bacterium]|nr:small ribosomal subunit Rsm22 family protein [Candidatus Binatia bacterium]